MIIGSTQKHAKIDYDGVCPCLTSAMGQGGGHIPMFTEDNMLKGGKQLNETIEKNIDKFEKGKVLNMDLYNRTVNEELSQTLTDPTHNSQRLYDGLRIRKLTPKECWRLMGFDDSDFEKAEKVNSNTQLYKQAGNSIVVNVLERILENLIDKNEHIRILELFGGIGACSKALERLRIDYEIVDYVEIDKYAVKSFNAMHNTNFEPQDICEWDKDIECDLIMHGSPCQDFSLAGKQAGGDEGSGTRSSLMYETLRIVEKLKPKYVIWENVKNVISKKHKHNFDNYLERMEELGYTNYYQVLNAKDYGIPQNRERVFTVSILGNESYNFPKEDMQECEVINPLQGISGKSWQFEQNVYSENSILRSLKAGGGSGNIPKVIETFVFPPKQELKLKLKDMLENEVDEKYYLSNKMVNFFYKNEQVQKEKGNGSRFGVSDGNVIGKAVTTRAGSRMDDNFIDDVKRLGGYRQPCVEESLKIKNATKQGYLEAYEGDGVDISSRMEYHRGNVQRERVSKQ